MEDPELLSAYLDFYWPVSREQARHALALSARMNRLRAGSPFSFLRVIDAGSGPGPVAAAFAEAGAVELTLLDRSPRALELALREIPRRSVHPGQSIEAPGGTGAPVMHALSCDIADPPEDRIPLWGAADCVSFGHSLNELFAGESGRIEKRFALLERYGRALVPGGTILVIEPALLSTSRDLLELRNLLVSRGWTVLAPCPGREKESCPALDAGPSHTCHEEVSWEIPARVASLAASLGIDKESVKMTWFLFAPPGYAAAKQAPSVELDVWRVVSDPMLNKAGRCRRLLCGSAGRIPLSVRDGSPEARSSGFDELRRGDLVILAGTETRENGMGVCPGTRISAAGDGLPGYWTDRVPTQSPLTERSSEK
jgi:SAM-dependent methyltransferase